MSKLEDSLLLNCHTRPNGVKCDQTHLKLSTIIFYFFCKRNLKDFTILCENSDVFLLRRVISCRTNLLNSVTEKCSSKTVETHIRWIYSERQVMEPILSGNKEIAFQQFIVAVQPITCITCGCLASLLSLVAVWLLSCHLWLFGFSSVTCGCLASLLSLVVVGPSSYHLWLFTFLPRDSQLEAVRLAYPAGT